MSAEGDQVAAKRAGVRYEEYRELAEFAMCGFRPFASRDFFYKARY
jgi:hypothetical protein